MGDPPKPGQEARRGSLPVQSFHSEMRVAKLNAHVRHLRRENASRRIENLRLKADIAAYEQILRGAGLL